jgi:hypothetical protein
MRSAIVAFVTAVALLTSVMAGPRKVLVLPLDGTASQAQRDKINASVVKLAKSKLDGDVSVGDTTFNETAAAVGCDPAQPTCAETVRTTLQVDELVYGTANTADGSTTVIVTRTAAGAEPASQTSVISESDSGEAAEGNLEPLFVSSGASGPQEGSGSDTGSGSGSGWGAGSSSTAGGHFFDTKERKLGVAFAAGGGVMFLFGIVMWNRASHMQDDIDAHRDRTAADVQDLMNLEDEAANKALLGNIFVLCGLAVGAIGGYYLWKDHKNRTSATVAPTPVDSGTGMTLVLGGRW